MKHLEMRVGRIEAVLPEPPPPAPPIDPSRLTREQLVRMAELQERWQAVGIEGLTDAELDEVIAMRAILVGEA